MANILRSVIFGRSLRAATRLVARGGPVGRLLVAASLMARRGALASLRDDVSGLVRMVGEVMTGRYRKLPQRALIAAIAGLIYLVNPIDLLPDVLPMLGLVDDAVVLTWVLRQIRRDVDEFRAWEQEWGRAIDVPARAVVPPGLEPG